MNDTQRTIEIFEKPSKHIRCAHECSNGMQFLTYSQDLVMAFETAIDGLKELEQYRAIGTVEECKASREKMNPKKSSTCDVDFSYFECPNCGNLIYFTDDVATHKFCLMCGQALSWESD